MITEKEIDFIVGNARASLEFEDMPVDEETVEDVKKVLRGEMSEQDYKNKVLGCI